MAETPTCLVTDSVLSVKALESFDGFGKAGEPRSPLPALWPAALPACRTSQIRGAGLALASLQRMLKVHLFAASPNLFKTLKVRASNSR